MLLLAPFAPYLARELWEMLGEEGELLKAPWPAYDAALAKEEELEIPVQINGKLRSRITVPADIPDELRTERVLADEKIKTYIEGLKALGNVTVSVINARAVSNVVAKVVTFDSSKRKEP